MKEVLEEQPLIHVQVVHVEPNQLCVQDQVLLLVQPLLHTVQLDVVQQYHLLQPEDRLLHHIHLLLQLEDRLLHLTHLLQVAEVPLRLILLLVVGLQDLVVVQVVLDQEVHLVEVDNKI